MIMNKTRLTFVQDGETKSAVERKKSMRAYMKQRRAHNENRDVKEELQIANLYAAISKTKWAGMRRTFFVYLSFSSETPTDKLVCRLQEDGHRVVCPRIENGRMVAVEYGEDFTLSDRGIREPIGEAYEGEIDVAIVPMLAVDIQGNRLGYGGGYYDKFFEERSTVYRIAYGYDFQIVPDVPNEPWDVKMNCIVTDKRVVAVEDKQTQEKI